MNIKRARMGGKHFEKLFEKYKRLLYMFWKKRASEVPFDDILSVFWQAICTYDPKRKADFITHLFWQLRAWNSSVVRARVRMPSLRSYDELDGPVRSSNIDEIVLRDYKDAIKRNIGGSDLSIILSKMEGFDYINFLGGNQSLAQNDGSMKILNQYVAIFLGLKMSLVLSALRRLQPSIRIFLSSGQFPRIKRVSSVKEINRLFSEVKVEFIRIHSLMDDIDLKIGGETCRK